jgi:hypothetical protein
MHASVRLRAALQIDAGTMNNGLAALECPGQCSLITDIGSDPRRPVTGRNRVHAGVTSDENHLVPVGEERTSRVAADEAAHTRDRNPGHSIDTVVAGRRRPLGALPRS